MTQSTHDQTPVRPGAEPVRLIPRPEPGPAPASGSHPGAAPRGVLDLMAGAVGQCARVEINLPGGPHEYPAVHVLETAVHEFMVSCGCERSPDASPEAGSWFRHFSYRMAPGFDSSSLARVFRAALVDLMSQAHARGPLADGARGAVIAALAPFASATLVLGCLLVVKAEQDGHPVLVVCPVAEDLTQRLAEEPEFLRDPAAVLAFLQRSPWLLPMLRWTRHGAPASPAQVRQPI